MFRFATLLSFITLCLLFVSVPLSGQKSDVPFQYDGAEACRKAKAGLEKIYGSGGRIASDNIDVISYTINLNVDFDSETITARCDVIACSWGSASGFYTSPPTRPRDMLLRWTSPAWVRRRAERESKRCPSS